MRTRISFVILQLALAFFLIVAGIAGLMRSNAGELNQVIILLDGLFKSGTVTSAVIITLALTELIAGLFLIVEFFSGEIRLINVILLIFMILWVINIVLIDVLGAVNGNPFKNIVSVLNYLSVFSRHLMILGAIIMVKNKR